MARCVNELVPPPFSFECLRNFGMQPVLFNEVIFVRYQRRYATIFCRPEASG
jgi:hypothetical protein